MASLTRRQFIGFVTPSLLVPLVGCGGGSVSLNITAPPDLLLSGDERELSSLVSSQFSRLRALAQNPGTLLRVGVPVGNRTEVLAFSLGEGGVANYRHLRVLREATGEEVYLVWGFKGMLPSIRMVDGRGQAVARNGQPIEVGFADVPRQGRQASDWIATGVKVAAIAFALWLGVGIARAVLAAVGFLAFNAMVLGLLVAAVGVLSPAIDWVLSHVTLGDVQRFFEQLVDDIVRLLQEVAGLLSGALP